jgi:hypothetical protein
MFTFTDDERASLSAMRAITTDGHGREVLVGLTVEETEFCMERSRRFLKGQRDRDGRKKYLELRGKHERARLQVLGAEIEARNEKPTLQ